MRHHTEEACDQIDAAIFSGDEFQCSKHRAELRGYLERWAIELQLLEEAERCAPDDTPTFLKRQAD